MTSESYQQVLYKSVDQMHTRTSPCDPTGFNISRAYWEGMFGPYVLFSNSRWGLG